MCGGILLAQTTDAHGVTGRSKRGLIASAAYNGGRVVSYTAVGAVCGALGAVITYTPNIKSMVFTVAGALVLLIDCRIPTQESDRVMADFARARNLPVIAVLTKADKCTLKERSAQQKAWEKILGGQKPLVVSAVTRLGLDELWEKLREAGAPEPELPAEPENDAPSLD